MLKRVFIILGLSVSLILMVPIGLYLLLPGLEVSSLKLLFSALAGSGIQTPPQSQLQHRLHLPEGFHLKRYAGDIPGARMLLYTEVGDLLVSVPRKNKIILLQADRDKDGLADARRVLLDSLQRPHGLAYRQGWLYIAEEDKLGRIRFDPVSAKLSGDYQVLVKNLPRGGNHWSRSIQFGPEGWLYLSIGSSCNVCLEKDQRRATIMRFQPDGSDGEIFASGLRNSVGFDWAPWSGELYATDNGRDMLGDDYPPCELNKIVAKQFYGWPFINGFGDLDPDEGKGKQALLATAVSPAHGFRAHNAPLGMLFNRSSELPAEYRRSAFVALHGSWNRSIADGYKVVSLHWDEQGRISERDFITGFELDGDVIGRPVALAQGQQGELYISDDYSGAIYRVQYEPVEEQ